MCGLHLFTAYATCETLVIPNEVRNLLNVIYSSSPLVQIHDYPARKLTSNRDWKDLILEDNVMEQVREIELWTKYRDRMLDE